MVAGAEHVLEGFEVQVQEHHEQVLLSEVQQVVRLGRILEPVNEAPLQDPVHEVEALKQVLETPAGSIVDSVGVPEEVDVVVQVYWQVVHLPSVDSSQHHMVVDAQTFYCNFS